MSEFEVRIITPPDSIADAEAVRTEVFQVGQGIAREDDFDGNDPVSSHVVVYNGERPVGTGRLRPISEDTMKIERVAVVADMRKHGIGKLIMQTADQHMADTGVKTSKLDSQYHAKPFYEKLGYKQKGDIFMEVGIEHVVMEKNFE